MEVAAQSMGLNTLELSNMLRKGEVVTKDFLPKFLDLYEKNVVKAGAFAKSLKTITVAQQNMVSQWQLMIKSVSEKGGKNVLIRVFESLRDIITNITPGLQLITSAVGGIALALAGLVTGFTAVTAPIVKAINFIMGTLISLTGVILDPNDGLVTAFELLGFTMATVFIATGGSAIAGMVAGLVAMIKNSKILVNILKVIRQEMQLTAFFASLSTGGVSALAGAAAFTAATLGAHALLTRGSGETNTTNTTTTSINIEKAEASVDDIRRMVEEQNANNIRQGR
jgi:hypothetical protein